MKSSFTAKDELVKSWISQPFHMRPSNEIPGATTACASAVDAISSVRNLRLLTAIALSWTMDLLNSDDRLKQATHAYTPTRTSSSLDHGLYKAWVTGVLVKSTLAWPAFLTANQTSRSLASRKSPGKLHLCRRMASVRSSSSQSTDLTSISTVSSLFDTRENANKDFRYWKKLQSIENNTTNLFSLPIFRSRWIMKICLKNSTSLRCLRVFLYRR
mmetsp:Transcript_34321/g.107577  ORF Transcript_34321/g.107577 Transcript_34321/m.107577 type:complete len:215 (+) Transcript_34321:3303-3947(+)